MHCSHVAAQNVVSENRVKEKKCITQHLCKLPVTLVRCVVCVCVFITCEAKKLKIHGYLN